MPYIANPLEGIPLVNTFITDQTELDATPVGADVLIVYDTSASDLRKITLTNFNNLILTSPAFTGTPTAPTANAGTDTTQLATTAFVTAATSALNTITSNSSGEILKWNGSAWVNNTLAEANILPVAGPTFTGVLTVGSAALSEADLEQIDDLTAGTAVASKALVVDANKDIGTIRNLTIDGVFTDGNYTFDTSGNVSGLGTIGSGNITSSGTVQGTTITATTAFVPDASDGAALGTSSLEFSDLFLADSAVINFGDDQDVTLTHIDDAGLLLNSDNYLTFRDSALKIYSSADGQLDIDADTEIEITATTVDLNGNLDVSGTLAAGTTTIGTLTVAAASITDSSGALTFGNENLSTTGTLAAGTTTIGTLVLAAASITDSSGGISFGDDNITTTGTVSAGNLTVTGTTTTINSTVTTIVDPIIHLQTASGGGALGSDTNKDVGLAMQYHNGSAAKTAFLGFDDSAAKLTFIPDATLSSEVVSGSVGTIVANLEGDVTGNTSGTAATVTGAAQSAITSAGTLSSLAVTGDVVQGTLTTGSGSITDSSGAITFGNENLTTTGTLGAGTTTIGTLVVAAASITDSSGAISFGDENLTTTGTLNAGVITATGFTIGSAVIVESELEMIDGITAGTAAASKAMVLDASSDISGARDVTITGEINAVSGDFSGNVDIAGTLTMSGDKLDMSSEDIDNARSITFIAEVDNGNSSTSDTVDWGAGQKQKSTLTGNCTYTFTAPDGTCNLIMKLIQDGTGSRTVTWPNTVKWPAGEAPTLTTTAAAVDIIAFYYDGTNYYGMSSLAFS